MIKYRTKSWSLKIEEVEIKRQTLNSVWLMDNARRVKMTQYENYFDTKAEAKAYLVDKAQARVASRKQQLHKANSELGNAKAIKV